MRFLMCPSFRDIKEKEGRKMRRKKMIRKKKMRRKMRRNWRGGVSGRREGAV